jgi:hypothetical protein
MTEDIEPKTEKTYSQNLIDSAFAVSQGNDDAFLDLLIRTNRVLIPDQDFGKGIYASKEKLRDSLDGYLKDLKLARELGKETTDFTVTLGDGHHRLSFFIDYQYPEDSSVLLTHSFEVQEDVNARWQSIKDEVQT